MVCKEIIEGISNLTIAEKRMGNFLKEFLKQFMGDFVIFIFCKISVKNLGRILKAFLKKLSKFILGMFFFDRAYEGIPEGTLLIELKNIRQKFFWKFFY